MCLGRRFACLRNRRTISSGSGVFPITKHCIGSTSSRPGIIVRADVIMFSTVIASRSSGLSISPMTIGRLNRSQTSSLNSSRSPRRITIILSIFNRVCFVPASDRFFARNPEMYNPIVTLLPCHRAKRFELKASLLDTPYMRLRPAPTWIDIGFSVPRAGALFRLHPLTPPLDMALISDAMR